MYYYVITKWPGAEYISIREMTEVELNDYLVRNTANGEMTVHHDLGPGKATTHWPPGIWVIKGRLVEPKAEEVVVTKFSFGEAED